jgi:dTDP-4-amino-4,6-dideoxygalactose transaminase
MDFIDLKSQYRALRREINTRIQAVLDHGQYILGPEVQRVRAAAGRLREQRALHLRRQRHRGIAWWAVQGLNL